MSILSLCQTYNCAIPCITGVQAIKHWLQLEVNLIEEGYQKVGVTARQTSSILQKPLIGSLIK